MAPSRNLLAPEPILLPADPAAAAGADLTLPETLAEYPASPLAWATHAEARLAGANSAEDRIVAYAFARTAYHRSLDRLRANGWKGFGPVPASHEPNQGVLRAIAALAQASQAIGDTAEYDRCRDMLVDADPAAVDALL
ncbi:DUF3151 domain-containing protein [Corynebacterium uterequi]|uniref:Putative DUF3151 family protein n=1 Tax=Corynebacterium uterequi TaxID=1072256 RepID=A0A0G3HH53_9CORY|nr:DUF3151 domain-containing protein [Corynebacterium uterequi]AKK10502.1 putative DUF3151 family protein [Corynebacterium uterequi]